MKKWVATIGELYLLWEPTPVFRVLRIRQCHSIAVAAAAAVARIIDDDDDDFVIIMKARRAPPPAAASTAAASTGANFRGPFATFLTPPQESGYCGWSH